MLIGTTTAGLSTAVGGGGYLFDGSLLGIAAAAMIDRNGETHLDGIMTQVAVGTDWQNFGNDQDPVINAAVDWLNEQPECASAPTETPAA